MLEWEETEISKLLGVPAEYKEESGGPFHQFNMVKNDVGLELSIFPFESDIEIRLYASEPNNYILKHNILNCSKINILKESALEFIDKNGKATTKIYTNPKLIVETLND